MHSCAVRVSAKEPKNPITVYTEFRCKRKPALSRSKRVVLIRCLSHEKHAGTAVWCNHTRKREYARTRSPQKTKVRLGRKQIRFGGALITDYTPVQRPANTVIREPSPPFPCIIITHASAPFFERYCSVNTPIKNGLCPSV